MWWKKKGDAGQKIQGGKGDILKNKNYSEPSAGREEKNGVWGESADVLVRGKRRKDTYRK